MRDVIDPRKARKVERLENIRLMGYNCPERKDLDHIFIEVHFNAVASLLLLNLKTGLHRTWRRLHHRHHEYIIFMSMIYALHYCYFRILDALYNII